MMAIFDKFGDFFGIGVISTIIDWGMFALLILFKVNYVVAVVISFILGALFNFYGNRGFTFEKKDKTIVRMGVFIVVACTALFITTYLMKFIVDVGSLSGLWLMGARMFVTIIVFIYNYFVHKYLTFGSWL